MDPSINRYKGKKVLVIGGMGFIGLNLVSLLLDRDAEVTIFDQAQPSTFGQFVHPKKSGLKIFVGDLKDFDSIRRAVMGQEVIFSLAGKSGVCDSNLAPFTDQDINCRAHLCLLEACRKLPNNPMIVFPSTRLVYGVPSYLPVDEKHPLAPMSMYATDKLASENYLILYSRLYGLRSTILRISNPYGPLQPQDGRRYGFANIILQNAVADGSIIIYGEGRQKRDYLFIEDLAEGFLLGGMRGGEGCMIFNIGGWRAFEMIEFARMAVAAAGRGKIVQRPWPPEFLAVETGDYCSDISLAREELGWDIKTDLETGINRTVEFYLGKNKDRGLE